MDENEREILARLAEPFPAESVSWKPQSLYPKDHPTRAMAVAYIDARDVAERLDAVCGLNWEFTWQPDGDNVRGCLTLYVSDRAISREDVGEPGDSEEGKSRKAAVSDALKRCAVQFGVGRYLYRLPRVWVGYDEGKRHMTEIPQLPEWALPKKAAKPSPGTPTSPEPVQTAPDPAAVGKEAKKEPSQQEAPPASGKIKPAIIKAVGWKDMLSTLAESDAGSYYAGKNGQLNAFHVTVSAAKLGFPVVTDDNLGDLFDALVQHGLDRIDEARQKG